MKQLLLVFSFVVISHYINAQSPRLSLYEEFTGETCPPCASTNPGLNALLAAPNNSNQVVAIKWQVPIPSAPTKTWSLYQTNKTEINWRYSSYGYGINSAPSGRMDGQNVTVFGASSDHPITLDSNIINTAQSYTSPFSISMTRQWNNSCTAVNLTITVQATANFTATGNLIFRTVMVERLIQFSVQPGTNGETKFEDVAIKSFPTINGGTPLTKAWTNGQSHTFTLSCAVPSYTRKKDEIAFVGFIQDDGNRKVMQAARTSTSAVPQKKLAQVSAEVMDAICSAVQSATVSFTNVGPGTISSFSIQPIFNDIPGSPVPFTANLAAGATTVVTLLNISAPSTNGVHKFNFEVLLDVMPYELTNSHITDSYLSSVLFGAGPVNEEFISASLPPLSWSIINNNGGPSWVKSALGGYNKSYNSAKYDFYSNPAIGDKDEMYLPPLDMSGPDSVEFSFDMSYAMRDANSDDKLEVKVSSDCGQFWQTAFNESGPSLATVTDFFSGAFAPSKEAHWVTHKRLLTGFNKPNLLIKFVTTNSKGNNLYIDNVNVKTLERTTGLSKKNVNTSISVFPNPTSGNASIIIDAASSGPAQLVVSNMLGQTVSVQVKNLEPGRNEFRIDLNELPEGVYILNIKGEKISASRKLTINR